MKRFARGVGAEERAQATVEMAIVAPVLLVLALIVYNLMVFVSATARFDRVAPDMVLAHGVAPAGDETPVGPGTAALLVQAQLEEAMESYDVEVEVTAEQGSGLEGGLLSMMGSLRTYRCTMTYHPWPAAWSIAGVSLGAPLKLEHVREVTVDLWKSGVVV